MRQQPANNNELYALLLLLLLVVDVIVSVYIAEREAADLLWIYILCQCLRFTCHRHSRRIIIKWKVCIGVIGGVGGERTIKKWLWIHQVTNDETNKNLDERNLVVLVAENDQHKHQSMRTHIGIYVYPRMRAKLLRTTIKWMSRGMVGRVQQNLYNHFITKCTKWDRTRK